MKPDGKNGKTDLQSRTSSGNKVFMIKFSIHFGLVWIEMQSSLPPNTDAHRNHNVLGELCSLGYQPTFIDVCVKTAVVETSNIR